MRRPLIPGEFDAERWLPPLFLALGAAAWLFFRLGLETPGCLFRRLTGLPCLACGGTRCARCLAHLDLPGAFFFSPLVALVAIGLALWVAWSWVALLRRDPLRLRLSTDERGALHLRIAVGLALALNWAWLACKLPA